MRLTLWFLPLWINLAACNVEKIIFMAPSFDIVKDSVSSTLSDLALPSLFPTKRSTRAPLAAEFPFESRPRGSETWFSLHTLNPGQRYEVRICWLATQPTEFFLSTYTPQEIIDSPALISSLTAFSGKELQLDDYTNQHAPVNAESAHPTSSLFLLIESAADYFSLNETLMDNVPSVQADIILDPYLFNVLPESLISTSGYLVIVAIAGWYASNFVWSIIRGIAQEPQAQHAVSGKRKKR